MDPATAQTVGAGDDNSRYGWGKRPYSWEFSLSAQHELTRGISVYGGYFRRWFGNFLVTDDLSHRPATTTPSASRRAYPEPRPGVGRRRNAAERHLSPTSFYSPTAAAAARAANNFVGLSDLFFPGSNVIDHWNGFDVSLNMRLPPRHHLPGRHEHRATDHRQLRHRRSGQRRQVRRPIAARRIAHRHGAWRCSRTDRHDHIRGCLPCRAGLAHAIEVPRLVHRAEDRRPDRRVVSEHSRASSWRRNYAASTATLHGRCHRAAWAVCRVMRYRQPRRRRSGSSRRRPSTDDRLNQLDLRLGKILRYGRTRANISLDLYNLFNKSTITGASFAYSTWLAPSSVIAPRLVKVSVTFDF